MAMRTILTTAVLVLLMKGFPECDSLPTGNNPGQKPCTCRAHDGTVCEDAQIDIAYNFRRCKFPARCCLAHKACSALCEEDDHKRSSFAWVPTIYPEDIALTEYVSTLGSGSGGYTMDNLLKLRPSEISFTNDAAVVQVMTRLAYSACIGESSGASIRAVVWSSGAYVYMGPEITLSYSPDDCGGPSDTYPFPLEPDAYFDPLKLPPVVCPLISHELNFPFTSTLLSDGVYVGYQIKPGIQPKCYVSPLIRTSNVNITSDYYFTFNGSPNPIQYSTTFTWLPDTLFGLQVGLALH